MDTYFVPTWSLKNKVVFWIGLDFMLSVLLSALVERVGVSRMRDFLSLYVSWQFYPWQI